ncbi:hypothetical protein [Caldimonas sp. KR1-144]|uniref:hypothetical protein n=1 Tax=Caldimonas sp. KR1-144 TaxID=3400911 RepID=UPI003C107EE8
MNAHREPPIRAARRLPAWLAFALAFALLSAQGFGSWHRALHALGAETVATAAGQASSGGGHAAGSVECRLIDHLFHAERLPAAAPALALPALVRVPPSTAVVVARLAEPSRHYQARAPPQA